ncbi:EAL domain-containing protein [Thiomicrospira microaerophila]|uniref:EAL domain-containing protein n=1 Tax=Thiomicrospira microaerophila TaxID=406020 RepID=UPI0018E0A202|nr:EAL domain-containing protein [Thiomicrospira microaerophila]
MLSIYSLVAVSATATPMPSVDSSAPTVGVLAFRSIEQTEQRWQPLIEHINHYLATQNRPERLRLKVLFYGDLNRAMENNTLDYVFTNPQHFAILRYQSGLSPLATLMPLAEGVPVADFGGVIFTRADNHAINTLKDLEKARIAATFHQSFGGYLMQQWEMFKQGYQINDTLFTGMPHDNVVKAVLNHQADAGFIRTGILEAMVREGHLQWAQIKLINPITPTPFPQVHSTELYPEWPFAAVINSDKSLDRLISLALFNISADSAPAQQGQFYGFTPPGNYAPIEALMIRLNLLPDKDIDWRDVIQRYAFVLFVSLTLIGLLLSALVSILIRNNQKLIRTSSERDTAINELQTLNQQLEQRVARRTQSLLENEQRFQQMFDHHGSPMLFIDPDSGEIINANEAAADLYGYTIEQLQAMNIHQINTLSKEKIEQERQRAKQEARNYFIFPHQLRSGEVRQVEVHSSPIQMRGRTFLFSIIHDISDRIKSEQKIQNLAFYDPLTQLPNRRLLIDRLMNNLAHMRRHPFHGALFFIDLDHFKILNDSHGHQIGDQLLIEVAKRISGCMRAGDTVSRFGGDEFVVLLTDLDEDPIHAAQEARIIAEKMRQAINQPYLLLNSENAPAIEHRTSASIGISLFNGQDETIDDLMKWTDLAMYQAKNAGRNEICLFDPEMQKTLDYRASIEVDLRKAMEQNQLELYFQPQVDINQRIIGAEALLRWPHPEKGFISPAVFIPLAEESGLILDLSDWVLDRACEELAQWRYHPKLCTIQLAVNISAKQLREPDFVESIAQRLKAYDVNPLMLKLELTEGVFLANKEDSIAKMKALRLLGIQFSMDDFGTGYSSLSYLKQLPLSQLKIDQSFVRDLGEDYMDNVMVQTIITLGRNFNLSIVAEGVETPEQLAFLTRFKCEIFQGYLFSKPVPIHAFKQKVIG